MKAAVVRIRPQPGRQPGRARKTCAPASADGPIEVDQFLVAAIHWLPLGVAPEAARPATNHRRPIETPATVEGRLELVVKLALGGNMPAKSQAGPAWFDSRDLPTVVEEFVHLAPFQGITGIVHDARIVRKLVAGGLLDWLPEDPARLKKGLPLREPELALARHCLDLVMFGERVDLKKSLTLEGPTKDWTPLPDTARKWRREASRAIASYLAKLHEDGTDGTDTANVWLAPQPLGPFLVDRATEMDWLAAERGRIRTLQGLGGVGKTQLALRYARRNQASFDVVAVLDASSSSSLAAGLLRLAALLGLPTPPEADVVESEGHVWRWFQSRDRWLLVLDAAPDAATVTRLLPVPLDGEVIITSTNASGWRGLGATKHVDPLDIDFATEVLRIRSGRSDDMAASGLAERLGRWPLPLMHAASFCEAADISFDEYTHLLDSVIEEVLADIDTAPIDHAQTTVATVELALAEMENRSAAAAQLVRLCSHLAPTKIPTALLMSEVAHLPAALSEALSDPLTTARMFREARRFSLVDRVDDSLVLHRLVQDIIAARSTNSADLVEALVVLLRAYAPPDPEDPVGWRGWEAIRAHVLVVCESARRFGVTSVGSALLIDRLATFHEARGEVKHALGLFAAALVDLETVGADPLIRFRVHQNLATCIGKTDAEEGEQLLSEIRDEMRERYGGDVSAMADFADVTQNLALLHLFAGRGETALPLFEEALGVYGRILPEKKWHTSKPVCDIVNNIGLVHLGTAGPKAAIGFFDRARVLNDRAGRIAETARSYSNLGVAYMFAGELDKAEENHRRALAIRLEHLGEGHHETSLSRGETASTLRAKAARSHLSDHFGPNPEAPTQIEEAIALDEESLRALDPDRDPNSVERSDRLNGLGLGLYERFRITKSAKARVESQAALMDALKLRRLLGTSSFRAAQTLANLGKLALAADDLASASEHFRESLALFEKWGPNPHISKADALRGLAEIALASSEPSDRHDEALRLSRESLDIFLRTTGADSDWVLGVTATIARCEP